MKQIIFYSLILVGFITQAQELDTTILITQDNLSYSLYVPNEESRSRVIFFYEPTAQGSLPVQKFKSIAKKHSITLIGSNDSRNGPMETSISIMKSVIKHATENILTDNPHIYLSGFSGGSRTSALHASQDRNVKGVIGCGSGFPPNFSETYIQYKYVGVIGNADMNYLEMIDNESSLNQLNIDNILIEFYGNHSWPSVEAYDAAVSWILDKKENGFIDYYKNFADSLNQNNLLVALNRVNTRLEGSDYQLTVDTESKEFQKQKKSVDKLYQEEKEKQEEILNAFSSIKLSEYYEPSDLKSPEWWKALNSQLNRDMKKGGEEGFSAQRLKGFLRANSYERGYFSINSSISLAKKYFFVYNIVTDDSWYGSYWLAKCSAIEKDWNEFESYLKQSVKHGFSNFDYLKQDPVFADESAQKIINKIKD